MFGYKIWETNQLQVRMAWERNTLASSLRQGKQGQFPMRRDYVLVAMFSQTNVAIPRAFVTLADIADEDAKKIANEIGK